MLQLDAFLENDRVSLCFVEKLNYIQYIKNCRKCADSKDGISISERNTKKSVLEIKLNEI